MNMTADIRSTAPMGFEAFVEEMQRRMQEEYPDSRVTVIHADKNNDTHLTGIAVIPEGRNTAPTLYMEDAYKAYLEGRSLEEITSNAVRLHEEQELAEDVPLPDVTDFAAVKDILCCRPVSREKNSGRLEAMPHRPFLDLAIIYYIPVEVPGSCGGSLTVTDQFFRLWDVDEETLYRQAMENTRRLYPVTVQSIEDVIWDMTAGEVDISGEEENGILHIPFYILRCRKGEQTSAAAMLYGDVLQEFAAVHGSFYILPSSIYEVLLIPAGPGPADATLFGDTVKAVNREKLEPEEVLSDHVYYYHADTGEIEVLP